MCFVILIVVLATVIGIAVMSIGDKKEGIEGNKVGFRYPLFCVRLLMGEPDEVSTSSLTGEKEYQYHDQTFFGQAGSIAYSTHGLGVDDITLRIDIDENEAETLFNTISQSIESKYKDETGYYCNPVEQKEDGKLIQKMGVNKGAGGIYFTLSYLNGKLKLDGFDQW